MQETMEEWVKVQTPYLTNSCIPASHLEVIRDECTELPRYSASPWVKQAALAVESTVLILGISGNILALCALSLAKNLNRRPSTMLVMNLSAADLSYCLLAMPFNIITTVDSEFWCRHPKLCSYSAYLRYCCGFLDWTCLAMVALERYGKIVHRNTKLYIIISKRRVLLLTIFIVWSFHFGIMLLYIENHTSWGKFAYNPQVERCDFYPQNGFKYARRVNLSVWTFPLLFIIGISYMHIFIYSRKHSKTLLSFGDSADSNISGGSIQKRDMALAKTLFVLVCSYAFCVLPMALANLLDNCNKYPNLQTGAYSIYFVLYAMNNFIYAACHPEYRVAYANVIKRCCPAWLMRRLRSILPVRNGSALENGCNEHSHLSDYVKPEQFLSHRDSSLAFMKKLKNGEDNERPLDKLLEQDRLCWSMAVQKHQRLGAEAYRNHSSLRHQLSPLGSPLSCQNGFGGQNAGPVDDNKPKGNNFLRVHQSEEIPPGATQDPLGNKHITILISGETHSSSTSTTEVEKPLHSRSTDDMAEDATDEERSRGHQEANDTATRGNLHQPIWHTVSSSMTISGIEIETTSRIRLPTSLESSRL